MICYVLILKPTTSANDLERITKVSMFKEHKLKNVLLAEFLSFCFIICVLKLHNI